MPQQINKFLYWTPRGLSILFVLFLGLMSLDVFEGNQGFWNTVLALFMHNLPTLFLAVLLVISWKREIVGGISFILAGITYLVLITITSINNGFAWYYLAWAVQISGMAFFIGVLYLIGWRKRKSNV